MSAYYVPHLLQGRRFLILGATGGAGSRTALEISRCGGICTLHGRSVEKLLTVLHTLMGGGHEITTGQIEGGYDGIFCAVGREWFSKVVALPAFFDEVSLTGAMEALEYGVKPGGSIVLMSSVAAVRGTAGMSFYSAGKAAIEAMARCAAVELAPKRIRVNCIRAGAFDSPMHRRILSGMTPEAADAYAEKHPLGFGRAEDVAFMAVYLLSDLGKWITGSCLPVDGGFCAK